MLDLKIELNDPSIKRCKFYLLLFLFILKNNWLVLRWMNHEEKLLENGRGLGVRHDSKRKLPFYPVHLLGHIRRLGIDYVGDATN